MFRRLALAAIVALTTGGALACGEAVREPRRPDVVCIVIDTLRADHLPFYGYANDTAPFLGSLAAQGAVFRHALSSSSWTAPATASLFTSVYPMQHQVIRGIPASRRQRIEVPRVPDALETLPEMFRRLGYRTFGASDNMNIGEEQGFDAGFDFFVKHNYESAAAINDKVLGWASEIEAAENYFLYLHYMDPHVPYNKRDPWCAERNGCRGDRIASYDSEIHYVDARIRELAEAFRWDRNTAVVVLSDHGEEFGDHGDSGHGHTLYGELIDVPMLFYYPARWGGGRTIEARVSTLDVLPTLAALIGVAPDPRHQGRSLLSVLDGREESEPARVLYSHLQRRRERTYRRREQVTGAPILMRSVVQGDWKLVTSNRHATKLFNVADDPDELENLADLYPEIVSSLEVALEDLERAAEVYAGETETITLTEEEEKRLRALGYAE